ncbi:hypothetical protein PI23P_04627 [Polaribacter irgensii 23-P]|uniref:Uncharacterized protein n=1 Tax=Polaribacter irgensii 23-P TaxID=313594 RepID=A4BXR2_9FLAO|nr:hypothetical protein [Polaribacter irgensii]EAR13753.1 hypothetical protein PI23P_04627 [Polaribacter irgensii 23-P]
MCIKEICFEYDLFAYAKVIIVGNNLIVKHNVIEGYNYTEKMFPGDDSDRIPIYKEELVEFVLPENHNQRIDFVDDFTIY